MIQERCRGGGAVRGKGSGGARGGSTAGKGEGPEALSRYWDDTDIMSKISKKMTEMKIWPTRTPRQRMTR